MLTEASVQGKKDKLVGLKENVIVGRLIPAGTEWCASHAQDRLGSRQRRDRGARKQGLLRNWPLEGGNIVGGDVIFDAVIDPARRPVSL